MVPVQGAPIHSPPPQAEFEGNSLTCADAHQIVVSVAPALPPARPIGRPLKGHAAGAAGAGDFSKIFEKFDF